MRVLGWLVTLAVPLIAITLNVHLLASATFVRWEFSRPGFPAAPGFTDAGRLAVAVPSTLFLVRPITEADLAALSDNGRPLYTADEISHLVDVRRVVRRMTWLAWLAVLMLAGALVAAWRGQRAVIGRGLTRGGWLTVGLVVVTGLGIAVAWPLVFVGFHEVFFPPGTWQFPVDSGLIRLFPDQFWYDTAVALAVLSAVEGLGAVAAGLWLRRQP